MLFSVKYSSLPHNKLFPLNSASPKKKGITLQPYPIRLPPNALTVDNYHFYLFKSTRLRNKTPPPGDPWNAILASNRVIDAPFWKNEDGSVQCALEKHPPALALQTTHFHCIICGRAFQSRGTVAILKGMNMHMKVHISNHNSIISAQFGMLEAHSKHENLFMDPLEFKCFLRADAFLHFTQFTLHRLLPSPVQIHKNVRRLPSDDPSVEQLLHFSEKHPLKEAVKLHLMRAKISGPLENLSIKDESEPCFAVGRLYLSLSHKHTPTL